MNTYTIPTDFSALRERHFVLWRPRRTEPTPRLILGEFRAGAPTAFQMLATADFSEHPEAADLWIVPVESLTLEEGKVYLYYFEVANDNVYANSNEPIWCTDPMAWAVDYRPEPAEATVDGFCAPASVVLYKNGKLIPADLTGATVDWSGDDANLALRAPNNHLVLYELPTSWARVGHGAGAEIDVGSFADVLALVDPESLSPTFGGTSALGSGRAHLRDLGINGLELLPPADSHINREWGYATTNYFAADSDLGCPKSLDTPVPMTALARLVKACHATGIRVIADMVTGFGNRTPWRYVNFRDFLVQWGAGDPEQDDREAWGGDLFKYNYATDGYDPVSGIPRHQPLYPARQLMKLQAQHWIRHYHIDGIRMDSIETVHNYDFVQEFKDSARTVWRAETQAKGLSAGQADARFLVVGEELSDPIPLLTQSRLDAVWNEDFLYRMRAAVLGKAREGDHSFEDSIRKLIDCRILGFTDGAQAVNYITSHDVEGFCKERLYNYLDNCGITLKEERFRLAFVCLLTAVGIPMIFAGEEFADKHDRPVRSPEKQGDPVNYDRLSDPWRARLSEYVGRLVKFRIQSPALGVNDTRFLHFDFDGGRRVAAWQRGQPESSDLVVVVANFSDWGQAEGASYVIPNWPATPEGKHWIEVTQDRHVPASWVGREAVWPWEAKVYATA